MEVEFLRVKEIHHRKLIINSRKEIYAEILNNDWMISIVVLKPLSDDKIKFLEKLFKSNLDDSFLFDCNERMSR
jgi:hypothetical protein